MLHRPSVARWRANPLRSISLDARVILSHLIAMNFFYPAVIGSALCAAFLTGGCATQKIGDRPAGVLPSLGGLFYETTNHHRTLLPARLLAAAQSKGGGEIKMPDGRLVKLVIQPDGNNFNVSLTAEPAAGISAGVWRWTLRPTSISPA